MLIVNRYVETFLLGLVSFVIGDCFIANTLYTTTIKILVCAHTRRTYKATSIKSYFFVAPLY